MQQVHSSLIGGLPGPDLAVALERRGVVARAFAEVGLRVTIGPPAANDRFLAALDAASSDLGIHPDVHLGSDPK